jgi:hypothetical protein
MLHVIPFGKHKGTPIDELGDDYLWWVVKSLKVDDLDLRTELETELNDRIVTGVYRGRLTSTPDEREELSAAQWTMLRLLSVEPGRVPHGPAEGTTLKALRIRGYAALASGRNYISAKGRSLLIRQGAVNVTD